MVRHLGCDVQPKGVLRLDLEVPYGHTEVGGLPLERGDSVECKGVRGTRGGVVGVEGAVVVGLWVVGWLCFEGCAAGRVGGMVEGLPVDNVVRHPHYHPPPPPLLVIVIVIVILFFFLLAVTVAVVVVMVIMAAVVVVVVVVVAVVVAKTMWSIVHARSGWGWGPRGGMCGHRES